MIRLNPLRGRTMAPLLFLLCLLTCSLPLVAKEAPQGMKSMVGRAAAALNEADGISLKKLSAGNYRTVFGWAFRESSSLYEDRSRNLKPAIIDDPATPAADWVAVFWQEQGCQTEGDHVHRIVRSGKGWKIGEEIVETETLGFRLLHHNIELRLDPSQHMIRVHDNLIVERTDSLARSLQMRIFDGLRVDSILLDGKPLRFVQGGGVIYAVPPPGKYIGMSLFYHGRMSYEDGELGNYIDSNEAVLTSSWYPTIARLPTTNSVRAIVPQGWAAISQGDLLNQSDSGGRSIFSYRMEIPNSYFTFCAAPYFKFAKEVNGRSYRVWLLSPDSLRAAQQLEVMDESFRLFERVWGRYPFDHYTIVETIKPGWEGALESYTFTTYESQLIPSVNPHEWGHTWWGGFVPNTYLQDLWNESFATYSESLFFRYGVKGSGPTHDLLYWQRPTAEIMVMSPLVPLAQSYDALFPPSSSVGYGKGGLVMQELERTLGFDTLMRCMKEFREGHPRGDAATWSDFERAVNRTTEHDYTWWFDQWVRRPGLPLLELGKVSMSGDSNSGYSVRAEIVQSVNDRPYRMRVPIWLVTESDTIRVEQEITSGYTPVTIRSSSQPLRVLLDPEIRIPRMISLDERPPSMNDPIPMVIVAPAELLPLAYQLSYGFRPVLVDTAVTEKKLEGAALVLLGNEENNAVWRRLASECPFTATGKGITYRGREYPGGIGYAVTQNGRSNKSYLIFWITGPISSWDRADMASVAVYDRYGRLIDGEMKISERTSHSFEEATGVHH